jgi:hypothetical protein
MFQNSKEPFVFEESKAAQPRNFSNRNSVKRNATGRDAINNQSSSNNGSLMMAGSNMT